MFCYALFSWENIFRLYWILLIHNRHWCFANSGAIVLWWRHKLKHFPHYWPLWGEYTGHRWIPFARSQQSGPLMFLWCHPERNVEQTFDGPVNWVTMTLTLYQCNSIITPQPDSEIALKDMGNSETRTNQNKARNVHGSSWVRAQPMRDNVNL